MRITLIVLLFSVSLAHAGANYNAAVLADSPAAWWKLNETSGTTMVDSSGNGLDGTYQSIVDITLGQTGIFGVSCGDTSVHFHGTSGFGERGNNSVFHIGTTGELTVEGWAKIGSVEAGNLGFVTKGDRVDPSDEYEWALEPHLSLTDWLWLPLQANGSIYAQATSSTAPSTSAFQHVVGTIIDTTNVKIYVNGVLENTSTTFSGTKGNAGDPVWIAKLTDCSVNPCVYNFLDTYAAHVAIYPTALSAARVLAHYNAAQTDIAACAAGSVNRRRVYQMQ